MASSRCSDSTRTASRWAVRGRRRDCPLHFGHRGRAPASALCEAFEPAWCTGWEEKANEYLPHALGLPGAFPYLSFAGAAPQTDGTGSSRRSTATPAPDRPVAWIDDAHDGRCEDWAAGRRGADAADRDGPRHGPHRGARGAAARVGGAVQDQQRGRVEPDRQRPISRPRPPSTPAVAARRPLPKSRPRRRSRTARRRSRRSTARASRPHRSG